MSRPFIPPPVSHRAFAAIGGLIFVASLAVFAVCYTGRYGVVEDGDAAHGLFAPVVVNLALFSVFALHHSIFARTGLKAWLVQRIPPELERSTYVWIASLLFLAVCWWWQAVPGTLWRLEGVWRNIAIVLQVVSGLATLVGARQLGVLWLAGIRQVMGPPDQTTPTLDEGGLYRIVRHPIYLAWLLLVWSAPVMTATCFTFAAISSAYLVIAVPFEERELRKQFGEAYAAYARHVRWRIVPFIY